MDKEWYLQKIKTVLYVFFGFAFTVIVVRVLLLGLGANPLTPFVSFWYSLSEFFVGPFLGMYPSIAPTGSSIAIEISSGVAMAVYAYLFIVLAKSLASVSPRSATDAAAVTVDALFKLILFFLLARFLFKITGANLVSSFVVLVYDVSFIVAEPFTGILPTYTFGAQDQLVLETSTLIAIVIVVIFDIVSTKIIQTLRETPKNPKQPKDKTETTAEVVIPQTGGQINQIPPQGQPPTPPPPLNQTTPQGQYYSPNTQHSPNAASYWQQPNPNTPNPNETNIVPPASQQNGHTNPNLTINIQQPQQQPSYIDQRSINLRPEDMVNHSQNGNPTLPGNNPPIFNDNNPPRLDQPQN